MTKSTEAPVRRGGFLYSLANLGTSLSSFVVSTYVGYFYIAVVGLPPRWVGWGLFLFSWWNALNDPLLGWLSDRTRTRWGRRIPYIGLLALPLALTFAAIWRPPPLSGGPVAVAAYMLGAITVNDLLYSMVALNVVALLPEMFPVLRERAVANGWRQAMGLAGMLLGSSVAPVLAERFGWGSAGLLLGAVVWLALLLSLTGMHEHRVYAQASGPGLLSAYAGVLRGRAFRVFLGVSFLSRLALTTVTATVTFYAGYALGLGASGASWLLGSALLAAAAAMPVWSRVLSVWGPRRTLLAAELMLGLTLLPLLAARSRVEAMVICAFVGVAVAGLSITPDVMLADVVDANHVATGRREEGAYFGLTNLINRLPNVLQALLIGEMLTRLGFDANLAAQPAPVLLGLRELVSLVPAAAMAIALLLTWRYPLDGPALAAVRAQVALLRAQAESPEAKAPRLGGESLRN